MYIGNLPSVSNQADWTLTLEVLDDDTDKKIDLSGATIVFEVRTNPTVGVTNPVLSATTGNGKITIIDTGVFQVAFTRAAMQVVPADEYDVGCVITLNGTTTQFLIGRIAVLDGVVSQ